MFPRLAAVGILGFAAASAIAQMTQLPGTVVPVLGRSTIVGVPARSNTAYCTISLKPRFPAEFQAYCDDVSNPRSANYRKWLTPAQVGQQFGAPASTVSQVVNYLRSKGLTITLQADDHLAILAKGTVAQIRSAFNTTIKDYRGPDPYGRTANFEANTAPLSVPAAWASSVQAITGVNTWMRPVPMAQTQSLTPTLLRNLYNSTPTFALGFHGEGMTLGVSNFDGFNIGQNVPLFTSAFGLPVPAGGSGTNCRVVTINGGSQNNFATGEGDLDIQWELASAPLATIIVYDGVAPDEISVLTREANDNLCDIVSESYTFAYDGFPDIAMAAHNLHLAMTAQGMTYSTASGDSGTATYTTFPGAYPQCEPEVLCVGGTTATVDSVTGHRIAETAWDITGAGGGGWITSPFPFNVRPLYQRGAGMPAGPNFRIVPDIAIHAGDSDLTAYPFFDAGETLSGNGTSFSSPSNAGGLAILEQRLAASGTTKRLGRIQDLIYLQAGNPNIWFDVTSGDIGPLPDGTEAVAHPGWDFATGWGAPNYDALFASLLQVTTATPFFPSDLATNVGTFVGGDTASVSASDGIYYQVGSEGIPQFGQAAGVAAQFFVPTNTVALSINLQANSGGTAGGTDMVWLLNWNTGAYDLIGAMPLRASGSRDQVLAIRSTSVPAYVGPGGEVDAIVRGHFPIKPLTNSLPTPFTYKIDLLELLARGT